MPAWFQFPFLFGVPILPARRVIGIDPGGRVIKVVLAELFLSRVRFIKHASINLCSPETGYALPQEEIRKQLHEVLQGFGEYPLALGLPQHLTLSQVIDLPAATENEVERLVQSETYKLAGLSQTRMVSDYAPMRPFGRHPHAFWLSMCQENEISSLVDRLQVDRSSVCDATSTGNALQAAYLCLFPETGLTVLADLGLRSTTLSLLFEGQVVFATSFALGTEMFTETLANADECTIEEAEKSIREKNLFGGADAVPEFCTAVDGWRQEMLRIVQDWLLEHADLRLTIESFQFVLSGGGSRQPGLIQYLSQSSRSLHFSFWPSNTHADQDVPPGFYAVAAGVAIQALGKNRQRASLLPADLRDLWREQRSAQRIQSISFGLFLIIALLLGMGTWYKFSLASHKSALQRQTEIALDRHAKSERASAQIAEQYESIRPALEREKNTIDTLQTLALLQQARSNRSLWFVLFADDQSYFDAPLNIPASETTTTNLVTVVLPPSLAPTMALTNRPGARPGFIAEVCIPEDGEAMRRTLSQLVSVLKQDPRFKNVDTVPPEQRRALAEPKAVMADHHFALMMDLVENEFQSSASPSLKSGAQPALKPDSARSAAPVPIIVKPPTNPMP